MKIIKFASVASAVAVMAGCVAVPVGPGYYAGPPGYYAPPVYYAPSFGIGVYGGGGGGGRGHGHGHH